MKTGFVLIARLILGLSFVYMGGVKAVDPIVFLKTIRGYEMVDNPYLLNGMAGLIPHVEVVLGLLLVTGIAVRGTSLVLLSMLLIFSSAVAVKGAAIGSASDLAFCAVRFDCGCGGGAVNVCVKLLLNGGLGALSVLMLGVKRHTHCLFENLFASVPGSTGPPDSRS